MEPSKTQVKVSLISGSPNNDANALPVNVSSVLSSTKL